MKNAMELMEEIGPGVLTDEWKKELARVHQEVSEVADVEQAMVDQPELFRVVSDGYGLINSRIETVDFELKLWKSQLETKARQEIEKPKPTLAEVEAFVLANNKQYVGQVEKLHAMESLREWLKSLRSCLYSRQETCVERSRREREQWRSDREAL